MRIVAVCLAVLAGAAPAWAENRAVIIGNADYESAPDLAGSDTAAAARALREAGFTTQDGVDQPAGAQRRALEALARAEDRPGARIVVLNGRFLHDAAETWFMGTDAGEPGALAVGRQGAPLSLVMRLMAGGKPGSVLILGTDGQQMPHRPGLENGIGLAEAPAGLSVVTGTPEAGARALAELLRGHTLGQVVAAEPALRLLSGSAADLALLDRGGRRPVVVPQAAEREAWARAATADSAAAYRDYLSDFPGGLYADAARARLGQVGGAAARRESDRQTWAAAAAGHTPAGYETYLRRFPSGRFVAVARARLAELRPGPDTAPQPSSAAAAERALTLGRAERAAIQRRLAGLGLQPGRADGVFGSRTRAAIADWQRGNRLPATGYLSRPQLQRLAALDQQAEAQQDRGWWQKTGAHGDAEGLHAYLGRYPRGIHAEAARRQLAGLPDAAPDAASGAAPGAQAPRGDEATWRWVRRQGSAAAHETYLERFPAGRHAEQARERLATLRAGIEAARREEQALLLNPSTRRLIEDRLRIAGMQPGAVDGEFTDETREALRRYQAARNLRVTGHVTQQTISSLLSDVLR
ncbi:peptidoglycan-binding domain-containing protein [Paracoccus sp. TOH]|uniref:peptidoglycan-binding protein n=1 Tax=Paracoccus sp. TOH TaxID=1263728 RepID=UPI0025B11A58|nr:peptidoglycan-binding domain-containing protein [Paracoccus sp. TOH]WJS85061.1 peptidoglycan-binding protein [Paracoccus sp. TOH]